jgi:putative salt-induced outer membrane protein YdiY
MVMSKVTACFLLILLPISISLQTRELHAQTSGQETVATGSVMANPALSRGEGTAALDSLRSLSDSLSRVADSLAVLLDSLTSPGQQAEEPPAPEEKEAEQQNNWKGNFGMGLTVNRGNSEQRSIVSNLRLNRSGENSRFSSAVTVTNSKEHLAKSTNKGSFKSKYELDRSERFFYFATFDMKYNRQAGLNLRLAPGAGMGLAVIAKRKCRLNLNLGANPITEYRRGEPRRTHGYYLGSQDLGIDLNSRARLEQSMTYNARFDRVQEYLLTFEISLTSQLTSAFDLKLTLESTYNSRPPEHDPPYKRQDWMFYTAIGYNIW